MDRNEMQKKVMDIIASQLGVDRELVTPQANVVDDLGADSLDVVELVMELETAFDLEIPDEEAEKIRTVKDIVEYLAKSLSL